MIRQLPSLLACITTCALAIQSPPSCAGQSHALAATAAATSSASASGNGSSKRARSRGRADHSGDNDAPVAPTPKVSASKPSRADMVAAGKAALLEQSEARARAERVYETSQVSAPIVVDAKACRRVGANGESIYEQC